MYLHLSLGVEKYISSLPQEDKERLDDLINLLRENNGKLGSGHTKYLREKIWELRLESGNKQHRLLYTVISQELLVMLTAFTKKTQKTPPVIVNKAIKLRKLFLN